MAGEVKVNITRRPWIAVLMSLFCVFPLFAGSVDAGCSEEKSFTALFLLPLNPEQGVLGQAFLDGVIAAEEAPLDGDCAVIVHDLDTQSGDSLDLIWQQAVERQPDFLFGPLMAETQQQLMEIDRTPLSEGTTWLFPGEESEEGQRVSFSMGDWEVARNLMAFAWEQGENRLALLLPEGEGRLQLTGRIEQSWVARGGIVNKIHYGDHYSDLSRAVGTIGEEVDWVLVLVDQPRLQMVQPLMRYHDNRQPVYSLNVPMGKPTRSRDLEGLRFAVQPALVKQKGERWEADDLLRQVENIGFDVMSLLRQGGFPWLQQNGSFFGQSGRYTLGQGRLSRALCIVRQQGGQREILQCPERDTD